MPPRAIISAVLVLTGTLSVSAATLNPAARNASFQPRSTLSPAIIKPAQATTWRSKQRINGISLQKITPVWQTPAQVKMGSTAVNQPDAVVVRPEVFKAAAGT